jgi:hypothetical protein
LALVLVLLGSSVARAADGTSPLTVVLLSSWFKGMPWAQAVGDGLRAGLGSTPVLHEEFLDSSRFPGAAQARVVASRLVETYGDERVDVVVAESIPAARFLRAYPDLFPGARRIVVQSGAKWSLEEGSETIQATADYHMAIAEMVRLVTPRRIAILGDVGRGNGRDRMTALGLALSREAPDAEVLAWTDLPLEEIRSRVAALGPGDAIFMMPVYDLGNGARGTPREVAGLVAETAGAPLFTAWDTMLGTGILGGFMLSGDRVGRMVARVILDARSPPDPARSPYGYFYDARQLARWGLSERDLPPRAEVLFRRPPTWRDHGWEIAAALSLVVLGLGAAVVAVRAILRRQPNP